MCHLPKFNDPNLIVGIDTSDDAAVYTINKETAVIETVDFFTPVVDDPYIFGTIAAANSLSDIYAMGGKPLFALNIVCFPTCLPTNVLVEILRGGADKVKEAGAVIAGGHTIDDREPKYGLAVTGIVNPEKVLSNSNAKPGDVIIITKPIGTGILNTAVKGGLATQKNIQDACETMSYLNKYAMDIASRYCINSCTDVTGFGLLGHLYEMASGSCVSIKLHYENIPVIESTEDFAKMGIIPAGAYRNRDYIKDKVLFDGKMDEFKKDVLFDPQTSGGLLLSVRESDAGRLMEELKAIKTSCSIIGEVIEKEDHYIFVD